MVGRGAASGNSAVDVDLLHAAFAEAEDGVLKTAAECQLAIAESQGVLGSESARGCRQNYWIARWRCRSGHGTPHEGRPNLYGGMLWTWADQIDRARATLLAECRVLTETGKDKPLSTALVYLGELECRTGHWMRALHYADEDLRIATLVGDEFRRSLHLAVRGLAQACRATSSRPGQSRTRLSR